MALDLYPVLEPILSRVRQDITWKKVGGTIRCLRNIPLGKNIIRAHLRNQYKVGVCPIKEGETTSRLAVLDIDNHYKETDWAGVQYAVGRVCAQFEKLNFYPVAFSSSSGTGAHIFVIFKEPQDAYSLRHFLNFNILNPLGFKNGTRGVARGEIEIFPKQDFVPIKGAGNQFILPLAGLSVPLDPLLNYDMAPRESAIGIDWQESPAIPELPKPEFKKKSKQPLYTGDVPALKKIIAFVNPDCSYDIWIKTGMALHSETAGDIGGLDLWDEWSSEALTAYPGREALEAKWASFRTDKDISITGGFIRKLASENGWREDDLADFQEVADEPEEKRVSKTRFRPIRADVYLKRPRIDWLIKGILPRNSAGMTYGGSGDGKTFAILDMACAIALGIDWNGRKVRRGHVVYICAEGAGGFITRLQAYINRHKIVKTEIGDYLTIIPAAPNFLKKGDVDELAFEVTKFNKKTDLIIVDTLAQTSTGADENSAKDMNVMLRYVSLLRDLTNSASHLIHHAGKDEARGARGSSTLKADCDVQFSVSRDGDKRLFWVAKMKDAIDSFGWAFSLESEQIGCDEDNDVSTSCVVVFEREVEDPVADFI